MTSPCSHPDEFLIVTADRVECQACTARWLAAEDPPGPDDPQAHEWPHDVFQDLMTAIETMSDWDQSDRRYWEQRWREAEQWESRWRT